MADRPNFYILLGIEPEVDDWKTIEACLQKKKELWSKESMGNGKAKREAKRNFALLAEMRQVLSNPEARRREAEEAKRIRRSTREARERELQDCIEVLRSTRACNREQLDKLLERFDGVFSQVDIENRLAEAGILLDRQESPERGRRKPRESIDSGMAKFLRPALEQVGYQSLYELLGMPAASKPEELSRRAEEIYRENIALGRTDPRSTTINDLTGHCRKLFRSSAEKAKYDNFLFLEAMEGLRDQLDLAGADRVISPEELETLIRLAEQRGIDAAEARDFIEDYAADKDWIVQTALPFGANGRPQRAAEEEAAAAAAASATPLHPASRRFARLAAAPLLVGSLAASGVAFLLLAKPFTGPGAPPSPAPVATAAGPQSSTASPSAPATATGVAAVAAAGPAAPPLQGTGALTAIPHPYGSPTPAPGPSLPSSGGGTLSPSAPPASRPISRAAALPATPTVAVVALGDPLLASAVEQGLERGLRDGGLQVGDEHGSLRLNDRLSREGSAIDVSSILPALENAGFQILVLARIESLGQRELSFYGRKETAFQSRLRVHVFGVAGGEPLGSGWSESLEYTALNAESQAEQALAAFSGELAEAVEKGWAALRQP